MIHRSFTLLALLLLMMALVGCGGSAAPASTPTPEPSPLPTGAPEPTLFRIVPEETEVRFVAVEELLNTGFNTVIGATSEVEGEIMADYAAPAAAQIGVIRINLQNVMTDDSVRNTSLRHFIFQSNQEKFQFAEFVTTEISGLPDEVVVGEPFDIQITGDLTLHGETQTVTFDATVTPVSETRLEGSAAAEVDYNDFGLTIPKAAVLLGVNAVVQLQIDFVALLDQV
jgi:polyisoprenoid-binding protein YceI